jgi:hypothetical protein
MGSILVVTLMLSGAPDTKSQRRETTSASCAFEERVIAGMNQVEAEAGTNVRYVSHCAGTL